VSAKTIKGRMTNYDGMRAMNKEKLISDNLQSKNSVIGYSRKN
jgi:hypothetical protein